MSLQEQDILSAFDFSATLDNESHDFDPFEAMSPNTDVAQMEAAATAGNLEVVKDVVERAKLLGTAQQTPRLSTGSALFLAVQHSRKEIVEYLVSEEATVDASHVKLATLQKDTAVLELLFSRGWDLNRPIEWCIPPALAFAVEDPALVDWFLDRSADPNARCLLDITPLSAAVQFASLATIERLFRHGGSVACGQLMHYAVWRESDDRVQVMEYLLQQRPPPSLNKVMYQDEPYCFEQRKYFGLGTPLHDAAALGDLKAVQFLIAKGSDVTLTDSLGRLAIERAQKHAHSSVVLFLQSLLGG